MSGRHDIRQFVVKSGGCFDQTFEDAGNTPFAGITTVCRQTPLIRPAIVAEHRSGGENADV